MKFLLLMTMITSAMTVIIEAKAFDVLHEGGVCYDQPYSQESDVCPVGTPNGGKKASCSVKVITDTMPNVYKNSGSTGTAVHPVVYCQVDVHYKVCGQPDWLMMHDYQFVDCGSKIDHLTQDAMVNNARTAKRRNETLDSYIRD
jgi:hypothetical protein